ncbi:hypothetical protein D1007_38242 [Hordeum vulgare]|nr:hypothetical protein D1007_38242 [Hordeum vulgare]
MSSLSRASSSSHGAGRQSRGGSTAAKRSPVPYREDPMAYSPSKYCSNCGNKAPRWISWSLANPGRRYYSCVRTPACGFVDWHDTATSPFLRELLGDLRDKIWDLESVGANAAGGEVVSLRDELEMKNVQIMNMKMKNVLMKNELELRARCDSNEKVLIYKYVMYAVVIFLSGLFAGLLLA